MQADDVTYADVKRSLWVRGNLQFKLDKLQKDITKTVSAKLDAKKVLILSSRQIGKTYWGCVFALEYLIRNPRKIARVIAPTHKQCQELINDNLSVILQDAPPNLIKPAKSEYRYNMANGSSLRLGALERAYVDGNRGGNASLIIYEECGFVHGEDFNYGVDSVLGPQLLRSNGIEIFITSPSEEPEHPVHTKILPECEERGTSFRYTVYDSPSITPSQIIEAQRRCGGEQTDAWKREYLAQIIRVMSKVVIPHFDQKRHVAQFNLPNPCYLQLTGDWGGVRDLTVGLVHTYDFINNRLLIWDEIKFDQNTPSRIICKEMRKKWDSLEFHAVHFDVPGQTSIDLHQYDFWDAGIPPKSDWLATVQSMSSMFTCDQILIHPRCSFLIKSIKGGVFNKHRTDFERFSEPGGIGHCDALAALMYANRVQNRDNPYSTPMWQNSEQVFVMNPDKNHDIKDIEDWASANKFAEVKRFGKFR